MTFLFPFNQQNGTAFPSQQAFEGGLKAESYGQFGFSPNNGTWHGGIHITHNNAPWLKDEQPLQAIADGVVVACRISDTYQQSQFDGHTLDYSHDFCLLQHKIEDPKGSGDSFTFYALYMHLAPLCAPHRAPSPLARYRLRSAQQGRLEATMAEGALSLPKGAIIEQVQGEAVKQDGYLFKPFTVISCANTPHIEGQRVWLATEKEGKPTDIRSNLFFECEFTPERGQAPISCLRLNRDSQVWFEANFSASPMMLRHNSQLRALPLEAVRDGDYVLRAYELLNNSDYFKNPALQAGTQVWLVTAKYETMTELFDDYAQPYLVPNWLMTEVVGKTKVNLQGRGDPLSNGKGELTAGAVAFTLPKGTLISYDKSRDCSIQIVNGQKRMMARCQIASTTPVSNTYGQTAKVVWLCVEEDYIEVVQTRTMALNQTHCFGSNSKLVVKAGEAIGYLGRFDCAPVSENNPINSNYQVHFELLSTIQPPEFFISLFLGNNEKNKMAYRVVEDTANCDGYLDADEPSPFFNALSQIQSEDNNPVTSQMIAQKLKAWDSCKGVIAKHESEWGVKSQDKAFLNKLLEKNTKPEYKALIEHEKERIDNLIWLSDVSRLGISGHVWNWWPIHNPNSDNNDVDDVYIVTIDDDMSIEEFAKETYNSNDEIIIEHILKTNPHLKRSFHQIVAGMPMVISPYKFEHQEESQALMMADNLMSVFLTLDESEREWYAKNSTLANHVSLMLSTKDEKQESLSMSFNENHAIAVATGGIVGYQVINNAFNDRFNQFAKVLSELNAELQHVPKNQIRSHPAYKRYRAELKLFEMDTKGLISKFGNPSYLKKMQVKNINSLLNMGNRQLFRSSDFSKIYRSISDSTADLFGKSAKISQYAGVLGNGAFLIGARGNISDIWNRCESNSLTEDCARSLIKNGTSMFANYQVGNIITSVSAQLIPFSGGLSLAVGVGGNVWWGYNGGTYTDKFGDKVEYLIFDVVIDSIKDVFNDEVEVI